MCGLLFIIRKDLMSYYKAQYQFYKSYVEKQSTYERCGFKTYPKDEYDQILNCIETINTNKKEICICDIGCGNALLLSHIRKCYSTKNIIPYGVDFIEESIYEAQHCIMTEYAHNFTCACATEYIIPIEVDVILLDPSIMLVSDFYHFLSTAIKQRPRYYVLYTFPDVLFNLNLTSVIDFIIKYPLIYNNVTYRKESIAISTIVASC